MKNIVRCFLQRGPGFILILTLSLLITAPVWADDALPLGLDKGTSYDIYIGAEADGLSVIQGVKIDGTREFAGQVYLVIQADSFAGSRSEGVVLMSYVRAILPSLKITTSPARQNRR